VTSAAYFKPYFKEMWNHRNIWRRNRDLSFLKITLATEHRSNYSVIPTKHRKAANQAKDDGDLANRCQLKYQKIVNNSVERKLILILAYLRQQVI